MVIFQNAEFHNVSELITLDDGSVTWLRVPESIESQLDSGDNGIRNNRGSTGVEIRFVMHSDTAVIRMAKFDKGATGAHSFHIFRGGIQGGWEDQVDTAAAAYNEPHDFVVRRSKKPESLKEMSRRSETKWDPEVIRIIFSSSRYRIYGISGDIEPPRPEQKPSRTLLCYGSSITHGSNSLNISYSWASQLGHNLNMDVINLGFAGCCMLEPAMAEFIALEGVHGNWDAATLELGINVLDWDESKINERTDNIISVVAGKNPDKPVFVISPFYCHDDFHGGSMADKWRRCIRESVSRLSLPNVTYIDGSDILDGAHLLSADEVHPNIWGVAQIADRLFDRIKHIK